MGDRRFSNRKYFHVYSRLSFVALHFNLNYMKLFVAGIPNDFDDTDFREMFELYGTVSSAKIVLDRATGRKKGFGFVEMEDSEEARQAMHILDGTHIRGKALAVKEAGEQSGVDNRDRGGDRDPNRRRGGGGYGGGNSNYRPGNRDRRY